MREGRLTEVVVGSVDIEDVVVSDEYGGSVDALEDEVGSLELVDGEEDIEEETAAPDPNWNKVNRLGPPQISWVR